MATLDQVLSDAVECGGFLGTAGLAVVAQEDRLRQLLVRCGGCRFVCAAQDVTHLIECVVAGGDYVRDVSLPAGDRAFAEFRPAWPAMPLHRDETYAEEAQPMERQDSYFSESDCGGVFDGNVVTSDADPGL